MKKNASLIFTVFTFYLNATNYYVSFNTGNNSFNGLSTTTAKKTIQAASNLTMPGDTVLIMNGTYSRTTWGSVLDFQRNGTPTGYITFKPFPGHTPIITASGNSWNAVLIDGNYVILDGLEFEGNNANITLAAATQAFEDVRDAISGPQAAYNTNCMSIASRTSAHHVIIRNCKVHDFPGGGIGISAADYVTIEKNKVYNNSWYTMYATSGISVFGPNAIDALTSYKIFIRGNSVYNNKTQVPWYRGQGISAVLSDGNGIILDANNGTQGMPIYTGRTLVENNVSYNNGGGGIHCFQAARVDIINNTAYNNGTVVGYPEIDGQNSTDIKICNNIMYARAGGNCNGNNSNTIYNYNLYFNGPAFNQGANDLVANPQFVNPTTVFNANFQLTNLSPAINSGSNIYGQYSLNDINGVLRPQGIKPDRGAYEYIGISVSAISTSTSICLGQSVTLTASGATTYTWTNGVTNGVAFTPSATATYNVTGTTGSVSNTFTVTIIVKPLPNVTTTAINSVICNGQSVTLTASGASSYTWTNGIANGVSFTPTTTATYTVTGTSNGCSKSATKTVTVNPLPNVTAIATNSIICNGQSVTLTASGASTYTWTNGIANGVSFTPSTTATYTVTGTSNGCSKSATKTVTVNPLPNVTAIATNSIICNGQSVTLTASGANTYTWTNGINNGVSFTPTTTATYTVTGTGNGCSKSATTIVIINPLPNVTLALIAGPLCVNNTTVTLSGAPVGGSYSGIGVSGTSFDPRVSGVGTFSITYNYTDVNTCIASATQTVDVSLCKGIEELTDDIVAIFPNPTKDLIHVKLDAIIANNATIELYNAIGQLLILEKPTSLLTTIIISEYPAGIYTIRIASNRNVNIIKIIKE